MYHLGTVLIKYSKYIIMMWTNEDQDILRGNFIKILRSV
jgi:hypothetical protein